MKREIRDQFYSKLASTLKNYADAGCEEFYKYTKVNDDEVAKELVVDRKG